MTIVLRNTKGSALTYADMDGNFTDLNARLTEVESVTAIKWANVRSEINVAGLSSPASVTSYKSVFQLYQLAAGTSEEVAVTIHIPKDYVHGTAIYPHLHLIPGYASTGTVKFETTYSYANEYDEADQLAGLPAAQQLFSTPDVVISYQDLNDTHMDAHIVHEITGGLLLPNIKEDALILFKFRRPGNHPEDTYPHSVYIPSIDIYYQSHKFGADTR